jgi:uncharacterized protein (TIGR02246 family)
MKRLAASIAALLLFLAVLPPSARADDLDELLSAYARALNAHDAGKLAGMYAEDGLLLPPDGPMIRGRAAIQSFWAARVGGFVRLAAVERRAGEDIAYLIGTYRLGEPPEGKFVLCLKRTRARNGAWEITADMWNSSKGAGLQPAS